MMPEEAIKITNSILNPKQLNSIQEIVFLQSLAGKSYREIALEIGYDEDYIRSVGSQLWKFISEELGEKVTKKNIKLVLSGYQIGSRYITSNPSFNTDYSSFCRFPGGLVPLHSKFYITRVPLEKRAFGEISKPGSLIRIRAPQKMGKTSLLYRIIEYAKEIEVFAVLVNFQQADRAIFADLNRCLRWFCLNISRQLGLPPNLDEYWDAEIGSKVSCTAYFQEYVLEQCDRPLILALDEVNQIFEYPDLAQDFLPLLRAWHEAAAHLEVWQKLRLLIVYNTEFSIPLKLSQSPFNVGLSLQLPDFTWEQTQELAQRYKLDNLSLQREDLERLRSLIGGHPYLVQLALYWLSQEEMSLEQLLQEAPTPAGIYKHHLQHHWEALQQQPELKAAFKQVVMGSGGVQLTATMAYRLESMGLIALNGNYAVPRYKLYQLYFNAQFIADV